MPNLLDVRDLKVRFGASEAVRGMTFQVRRGETLAIVGESGCGKSTTALALMRLLPKSAAISGEIVFNGTDLATLPDEAFRRRRGSQLAMIFQEPMTSLNPVMTVGRQIVETLRQHESLSAAAAKQRAIELMAMVKLPDARQVFDTYPHRLSGGMRQRIMIAIAVACRPQLLIADEPTTALDVTVQAQILDLLQALKEELKLGLLLITHDLGVVAEYADRVAVMYAGRKVEEAAADRLFAHPMHPYTRGLLRSSLHLESSDNYHNRILVEMPGSIASAASERGCAFASRCEHAVVPCRQAVPALATVSPEHVSACPVVGGSPP